MSLETPRVGVLAFHTSPELRAIEGAISELGAVPVRLNEESLTLTAGDSGVSIEPDIDVCINRILLSTQSYPLDPIGVAHTISQAVPIINDPFATVRATHKFMTLSTLSEAGISVPASVCSLNHDRLFTSNKTLTESVVYKRAVGTHGSNVLQANRNNPPEPQFGDRLSLIQSRIKPPGDRWWDRRIYVVADSVIAAMDRFAAKTDWRANIARGGYAVDVTDDLDDVLVSLAVDATAAIGLDCAGIDLITDGDRWYVLEVNPTAGFKGLFSATGISPAPYIVALALDRISVSTDPEVLVKASKSMDEPTVSEM